MNAMTLNREAISDVGKIWNFKGKKIRIYMELTRNLAMQNSFSREESG
jgi:hypothetical protein